MLSGKKGQLLKTFILGTSRTEWLLELQVHRRLDARPSRTAAGSGGGTRDRQRAPRPRTAARAAHGARRKQHRPRGAAGPGALSAPAAMDHNFYIRAKPLLTTQVRRAVRKCAPCRRARL